MPSAQRLRRSSPRATQIAIHEKSDLVFRFRFAFRLHLPAPAEGAASRPRHRVPAGAVRRAADPLGTKGPGGAGLQAPLYLSLEPLVGAQPRHPAALPGVAPIQSAAP